MGLINSIFAGENAPNLGMVGLHHENRIRIQHINQGAVVDEVPFGLGFIHELGDCSARESFAQVAAKGIE